MKSFFNVFILLLIVLVYNSCSDIKIKNKHEQHKIIITDSIIYENTKSIEFLKFNKNNKIYIAYDKYDKAINIYNLKGKKLQSFFNSQFGDEVFENVFDIVFLNDTMFSVLIKNYVALYNIGGNLISYTKTDDANYYNYRSNLTYYKNKKQKFIFYLLAKNGDTSIKEYYKNNPEWINKYNLNDSTFASLITFEKWSIHRNNEVFYSSITPHVYFKENVVFMVYPNEPILYKYDLLKNKLIDTLHLNLDYYIKPEGTRFGEEIDYYKYLAKHLKKTPLFSVRAVDSLVYIEYISGFKEDVVVKKQSDVKKLYEKKKIILHVLKNNNKLYRDMYLPTKCKKIINIINAKKIMMLKRPNNYDETNNSITVYLGKL